MSDVNTETEASKTFNAEAFAMNIAKAMELSGQALAAYLKPRETGEVMDKPPSEIGEVIKTFSQVAEYWLSDRERAADLQTKMGKAYLDLWGSAARRMAGEQTTARDRAVAARQALQGPRVEIEPVLRFRAAALSAHHAVGRGAGEER